jgi:hypothetical protein
MAVWLCLRSQRPSRRTHFVQHHLILGFNMHVKMRLLFRARQLDRIARQPFVNWPEACSCPPLEAMGAQYHVAALTGLRRTIASSVSCG